MMATAETPLAISEKIKENDIKLQKAA